MPTSKGGGGAAQLTASIAASSQQDANGLVTETAPTVAGGSGTATYAWTLTDPDAVDRSALYSDSTASAPTWTPDKPGAWTVACAVTKDTATVTSAPRIVEVGINGYWVYTLDWTAEATNDLIGDGTYADGGSKTWTLENDNASDSVTFGITNGTGLVMSAQDDKPMNTGRRDGPLIKIGVDDLISQYTDGAQTVIVAVQIANYQPADLAGPSILLEDSGNQFGSGSSTEDGYQIKLQDSGGDELLTRAAQAGTASNLSLTSAPDPLRVLVLALTGSSCVMGYTADTTGYTDPWAALDADAYGSIGEPTNAGPPIPTTQLQLTFHHGRPSGAGAKAVTIEKTRVFVSRARA